MFFKTVVVQEIHVNKGFFKTPQHISIKKKKKFKKIPMTLLKIKKKTSEQQYVRRLKEFCRK